MKLLIQGTRILAAAPEFTITTSAVTSPDGIWPIQGMPGYEIVSGSLPPGAGAGDCEYINGFVHRIVVPRPAEEVQAEIVDATQRRLDDFARSRNYDGILSACSYATSTVPKFRAEAEYCVQARDATWAAMYQVLAEVQAGTRPMPSGFADVAAALPPLVWPA
jgi:hypothetical protein